MTSLASTVRFDHRALVRWFDQEKRDLPWRDDPTPYAVWVSEIMLQQTQVAVVVPYFLRWMELFPTVHGLAAASLDEVIKAWEGLGYYSRARSLHAGAQFIVEHYEGQLPADEEGLRKIKGIGPYTMGAIRSFAFKQKAPAVDGNVIRVLARYFLIDEDVSKASTIKKIWDLAEACLPDESPWVFNEALIELGAMVCSRQPKCFICPLKGSCRAHLEEKAEVLPYKSTKVVIKPLYRAVAVIQCGAQLLVCRGQKGKIMSDLHEFPYFEEPLEAEARKLSADRIGKTMGLKVNFQSALDDISHSFTRYRVRLFPVLFSCSEALNVDGYQWMERSALADLAFSSGHRRIYQSLI